MINICPFCGSRLTSPLNNGITTCKHCGRVFESTSENRFLAAVWCCRRQHLRYADVVQDQYGLDDEQVALLQEIIDEGCSHEEVLKIMRERSLV